MTPLLIGYDERNEPLHLTADDLASHLLGIGASRYGKSKLVEWLCRQLIRDRRGFCLIDPHGHLFNDLVRWLAYVAPEQDRGIKLFIPGHNQRSVGFNPFRPGRGDPSVQADRRVQATVKVWGAAGTDETPRLERVLRILYYALIERGLSPDFARYFLSFTERETREHLVAGITNPVVRGEWEELCAYDRPQDFNGQIESAKNRLTRFLSSLQVRRMIGLNTNCLDLEDVIENGEILLVNLQPTDDFTEENGRLVGTLLVNELWEIARRRKQTAMGRSPADFFVILDEFQKFITPDIGSMLAESAKYGIHLLLFHQFLAQLKLQDELTYHSVMTNCQTKIAFGGLSRDDARVMAENLFPNQIDLKRIKFILEQTKFRPVYTRENVHVSMQGGGSVHVSGSARGASTGWDPSLSSWWASPEITSAGASTVSSDGYGDSDSWSEGDIDIPFYRMEEFKEGSSITPYLLEEQLWQLSDRIMTQSQRHYLIRRAGKPTMAAFTPFVKQWHVEPVRMLDYVERRLEKFLPAPEVDRLLEVEHAKLKEEVRQAPVRDRPKTKRRPGREK